MLESNFEVNAAGKEPATTDVTALCKKFTRLLKECFEKGNANKGQIFILGASSSEITGASIGSASAPELAYALIRCAHKICLDHGMYLAVQCCEHLNRVLVVEQECAKQYLLNIVNARPMPKAGGSFAAAAYDLFTAPVCVEHIQAHLGMDIGDTLIGMHLRPVAVPLRLSSDNLGKAHIVCAYTRPKYVGGPRTQYE